MKDNKNGETPSRLDDMIANVYEAVLDQDRFDELITLAESSITNRSAHRELLRRKRDIEAHFETAEKLLSSLQKPAEDYDRPVIRLGRDLTVLQANETAERILQITAGRSLEELDIDGDALGHLNEAVSGRAEDWPIVRVPHAATGKQVLLVLSAEEDPHNGKIWLLTGVERVWQQGASLAMQSLYGLTQSETDVLSMLVSGHTPAEIAEARDRSVETVRQQIKSMITKTRSRGSGELVAVARAIANSAQRRKPQTTSADHTRAELRLRDGRKIDYLEQGDTTGKAVVFLHGCLCGNRLPNTTNRYFSENGIRLLSPARPWHGQSDGHGILLHDPARYAHDICDWLDQLDLEQVQLVAFDVGAIFALVCLPHLRDRVAQLICISAQPPMRSFQDFSGAPPQQKLFALLPRVSVPLLSYMAKLGDKRLKRDGPGGFAQTVFGGAQADLEACNDPHLLDLFWQGHLFHVERGSDSFINDCRFVASDWEKLIKPTDVPIHFIHGTQNRSIRPERILAFAERIEAQVSLVENAGHSLPFSHWRDWVRFLD
ncbi:haloalkane dehalogenase [Labrenzia sp. THAF82]|uniref:alpha/beta fold hydrolase n=1 Tax=Labrenzia sp. THAF82 TaxID=2587861 RepID=UPI00126796C7|nr:alpha/beta fold hydrolase [Labrenzia sp. THAF82]QFT34449.1 haloalkane dehalogenase [Labrenzia sp. THAF82]